MAGLLEASVKAALIPYKEREAELRKQTKRLIADVMTRAPAQARKASRLRYLLKPKEFGKVAKIKGGLPRSGRIPGDPFAGSSIVFRTPRKSLQPKLRAGTDIAGLNMKGGPVSVNVLKGRPATFNVGWKVKETGNSAFVMRVRRNPANGQFLAKPVTLLASRRDDGGVQSVKTISPSGTLLEGKQVKPALRSYLAELVRKRSAHYLGGIVK